MVKITLIPKSLNKTNNEIWKCKVFDWILKFTKIQANSRVFLRSTVLVNLLTSAFAGTNELKCRFIMPLFELQNNTFRIPNAADRLNRKRKQRVPFEAIKLLSAIVIISAFIRCIKESRFIVRWMCECHKINILSLLFSCKKNSRWRQQRLFLGSQIGWRVFGVVCLCCGALPLSFVVFRVSLFWAFLQSPQKLYSY